MKSSYADYFNHDEDAPDYDTDVKNEDDPIRTGYAEVLSWIGEQIRPGSSVIDLGCGTGNTILALPKTCRVSSVDVSNEMLKLAQYKLQNRSHLKLFQDEILNFMTSYQGTVDYITSSYAIHHFPKLEKEFLFTRIYDVLNPGGAAIIGDLGFADEEAEKVIKKKYPELVKDIDDEFFWNFKEASDFCKDLGFNLTLTNFSDFSWGISLHKPSV
jgi:putative AdoMet-dependent methyltransferase